MTLQPMAVYKWNWHTTTLLVGAPNQAGQLFYCYYCCRFCNTTQRAGPDHHPHSLMWPQQWCIVLHNVMHSSSRRTKGTSTTFSTSPVLLVCYILAIPQTAYLDHRSHSINWQCVRCEWWRIVCKQTRLYWWSDSSRRAWGGLPCTGSPV